MRRSMKTVMLITTFMLSVCAFASPEVTDVVAKQRYPWNGLVDITCRVTGINGVTNGLKFAVSAVMPDSGDVRSSAQFWVMQGGTRSSDLKVHTNGNYRLLWDAKAELGQVSYDNMVMRVTVVDLHDKIQLWEGGPYWATTNIGAENPEDYGYYFWWGDTVGYKRENDKWVATDGSSSNFSFSSSNTPTDNKSIATLTSEGWITTDGVLAPEHDAAHVHWGGDWRMPTYPEIWALINNCTTIWTTRNGVYGRLVTGKGAYADRSIFLPAAGDGSGSNLYPPGSNGYYWSSRPSSDTSISAGGLHLDSGSFYTSFYWCSSSRFYGQSVRPVRGFAE